MSENPTAKPERKLEDAKKAIDKREDQLEQAAETAAPYLHEAKKRLYEASRSDSRQRHRT